MITKKIIKVRTPKLLITLAKRKSSLFGLVILVSFFLMATLGVEAIPQESLKRNPAKSLLPPSLEHPLGTDYAGRDIFAQIVHGSRSVLVISFLGAFFIVLISSIIGLISGYTGGIIDKIFMMITDIFLTLPGTVLFIVLAAILRRVDVITFAFLLSVTGWAGLARSIRSQVLTIKERAFVEAASVLGLSKLHIAFNEIMPNMLPYIGVSFSFSVLNCLYQTVGLFFLGLTCEGVGVTNWGMMMNNALARGVFLLNPIGMIYLFTPIAFITLFILSIVLIAGTREIFNPSLREEE